MNPVLTLDHVSYSYHTPSGETPALKDVSFSVRPGSFTSIAGPSGCGKSTLLSLIAGLIAPEKGCIRFYKSDAMPGRCPDWLYAPARYSFRVAYHL